MYSSRTVCRSMVFRFMAVSLALLAILRDTPRAEAVVIFSESFDTDTGNAVVTYPAFQLNSPGAATSTVSGGVLNLNTASAGLAFITDASFSGPLQVTANVGGDVTNVGSEAVGLAFGNYEFVFFPLYPNGALQIRTLMPNGAPGGVTDATDHSIGFTPAENVLHSMSATYNAMTGMFSITVTNGLFPFQSGGFSFTPGTGPYPAYVAGQLGFADYSDPIGLYDNFVVDNLAPPPILPEPSTWALLGLGMVGLAWRVRRRRAMRKEMSDER